VLDTQVVENLMEEDHIGHLKKARNELVRQRRLSISALKEGDQKNTEHQLTVLIRYQQAIEAIDKAMIEEQRAAKIATGKQPRTSIIQYED
jgi:hypothetical protein